MDFMRITDAASEAAPLTLSQLWTLMEWRRTVDAALAGSIAKHDGQDVAIRIQNQALEIFTTNLFRLRSPSEKVLMGIVHSLLPQPTLPIDYWFSRDPHDMPSGWPVVAPRVSSGPNMPQTRRSRSTVPPKPFGDKVWEDLDNHPVLKGRK